MRADRAQEWLLFGQAQQLLLRRTRRPPPRLRSQGAAAPLPAAAPLQQWMQPSPSLLHFVRDSLLALGCRHRLASGQHGALGPDLASVQRGPKVRLQTCSVVLFVLDKRLAPWVLSSLPCRASVGPCGVYCLAVASQRDFYQR